MQELLEKGDSRMRERFDRVDGHLEELLGRFDRSEDELLGLANRLQDTLELLRQMHPEPGAIAGCWGGLMGKAIFRRYPAVPAGVRGLGLTKAGLRARDMGVVIRDWKPVGL